MVQLKQAGDRRPRVDEIFDYLYEEIASMRLKPGDRISEADIAARFGVSRQPVRDAFSRLESQDLLVIRPQRATEVKPFSAREIEKSRFVRAAVEAEVLRRAAAECDRVGAAMLEECLDRQRQAIADNDYDAFGELDYDFHRTLCQIGHLDFAFEVISAEKAKVDRLCLLGLAQEDRMPQLVADHAAIAACVTAGDAGGAVEAGMLHLSRLDDTIEAIAKTNANFFEDDTG